MPFFIAKFDYLSHFSVQFLKRQVQKAYLLAPHSFYVTPKITLILHNEPKCSKIFFIIFFSREIENRGKYFISLQEKVESENEEAAEPEEVCSLIFQNFEKCYVIISRKSIPLKKSPRPKLSRPVSSSQIVKKSPKSSKLLPPIMSPQLPKKSPKKKCLKKLLTKLSMKKRTRNRKRLISLMRVMRHQLLLR